MSAVERRLRRVIDHVHADPGRAHSLDDLADVAAMSRFHWHRVWRQHMGETQAVWLRRIRMHMAASELARSRPDDLGELARRVGYPDVDSFARAFAAQYGMTPRRFRDRGGPLPLLSDMRGETMAYPVEIRDIPVRRLFGLPHIGAYYRIAEAYDRLGATVAARDLTQVLGPMIAIFYDDINTVPEAELTSFAALVAQNDMPLPEGLEERRLPPGPAAVLTFRGPYADLPQGYDHLFRTWFPASGREPSGEALYELYLNTPLDTAPEDLVTEIHFPLKPA
ncbi:AraC family transcriptional regulator [Oceanicola sp. 22II-s10i]|uniref:AraC family transcriptional regulator n=1 Tax=Oceanicola sp. 22II-s10i TaxID=1317116 RepID=UPI000B51F6D6|nr:AraC family transcriptional regulator [Oceanicola sp. 22II-s10i]OWU86103.1 AraC family transcriptional regulator [Oceanicola sp. 22II-s10i]